MRTNIRLTGRTLKWAFIRKSTLSGKQYTVYKPIGVDHGYIVPEKRLPDATIKIYQNRITLKVPGRQPDQFKATKRGLVSMEFTGKVRRRFMNATNAWRPQSHAKMLFITLTYPNEWPTDWKQWKADLENFRRRWLRYAPGSRGYWKMELQKRGAPHFHLLIEIPANKRRRPGKSVFWHEKTLSDIRAEVTRIWAHIAHKHDQYQGKYATNVRVVKGVVDLRRYIVKYAGKRGYLPIDDDGVIMDEVDATMGRLWGRIGKPNENEYSSLGTLSIRDVLAIKREIQAAVAKHSPRFAQKIAAWDFSQSLTVYFPGLPMLIVPTTISRLHCPDEVRGVLSRLRSRVFRPLDLDNRDPRLCFMRY